MTRGTVFFVGAGPGDPSLISVRGRRLLSVADTIVFDRAVHRRLLDEAPAGAERIEAGAAAPKPLDQEAIAYLLADKAREGRTVVRLKWGDSFVFDDGGKEALFLHEQGVRFEVVPGIPAALGAPCYAGVPVTYPGGADTLTFVRGYENERDTLPHVNWDALAQVGGTVVCYVSARQLSDVVRALLAHGWPGEEAAALIIDGTLPSQQTWQGTLTELGLTAELERFARPAILVVGATAAFREHLRWFDARPLFGRRVVVTRAKEQAAEIVDLLEDLGAQVIEASTIRILPPEDPEPLDRACEEVSTYDWVVFTSVNGVDHFMRHLLASERDVRDLKGVRICAVGPATAERVVRYHLRVDVVPTENQSDVIAAALSEQGPLAGTRILLPRADIARAVLPEQLRAAGADVTTVAAYRTVEEEMAREGDADVYRLLLDRQVDAVVFTSSSTVRSFVRQIGEEPAADLLRSTVVASIGPVTADAAARLNIATTVMPPIYTVPELVRALMEYFKAHPRER